MPAILRRIISHDGVPTLAAWCCEVAAVAAGILAADAVQRLIR